MSESILNPNDFSPHLFWDIDQETLNWDKHARFIIGRVLDYGCLTDWKLIAAHYGINQIATEAIQLRSLSKRSASFVAALAHVPKDTFACYSTTPSTSQHWIS